jgi:hypothetical protein
MNYKKGENLMNNNINEISFKSKECKNNTHSYCSHQWKGFGFQIICNCECHDKKKVLGRYSIYHEIGKESNVIPKLDVLGES